MRGWFRQLKGVWLSYGMKFKSTRGGVEGLSFEEALLSGRPADGGLYVPQAVPKFSKAQFKDWASLTYPQLVEKFMHIYLEEDDVIQDEIKGS